MKYELSRILRKRNRKARTTFRPNATLSCKPNFKKKIRGAQNKINPRGDVTQTKDIFLWPYTGNLEFETSITAT